MLVKQHSQNIKQMNFPIVKICVNSKIDTNVLK